MEITGQMLKDAFKKNPAKLSHVLGESIREFGYPDVTDAEVQEICRQVIDGKSSDDVVFMLINNWFINGM